MKTLLLTLSSRMVPIAGWQAVLLRIRADDHDHARRLVSAVKPHLTGDTAVTWSVKDEPEPVPPLSHTASYFATLATRHANELDRLKAQLADHDRELALACQSMVDLHRLRDEAVATAARQPREFVIARNQLAEHKVTIANLEAQLADNNAEVASLSREFAESRDRVYQLEGEVVGLRDRLRPRSGADDEVQRLLGIERSLRATVTNLNAVCDRVHNLASVALDALREGCPDAAILVLDRMFRADNSV